MDMTNKNKEAWATWYKFSSNLRQVKQHYNITTKQAFPADLKQVCTKERKKKFILTKCQYLHNPGFTKPHTMEYLKAGNYLKNGKAADLANNQVEEMKHFKQKNLRWLTLSKKVVHDYSQDSRTWSIGLNGAKSSLSVQFLTSVSFLPYLQAV